MRRFWASEEAMESACVGIKQEPCPHCGRFGTLNRHGWLRGSEAFGPGKKAKRGRRLFCTNRGRVNGCGHTFCLWLATILPQRRTRTGALWALTRRLLAGATASQAWTGLQHLFSLESAYRYRRQLLKGQFCLRERLWRTHSLPGAKGGFEELLLHLHRVFGDKEGISAYQLLFEEAWPG